MSGTLNSPIEDAVLDALSLETLSAAEIAEKTGYDKPVVTTALRALAKRSLVDDSARRIESGSTGPVPVWSLT